MITIGFDIAVKEVRLEQRAQNCVRRWIMAITKY
jgi:hypothetical protein